MLSEPAHCHTLQFQTFPLNVPQTLQDFTEVVQMNNFTLVDEFMICDVHMDAHEFRTLCLLPASLR